MTEKVLEIVWLMGWAALWLMVAAALTTGVVLAYRLFGFPGDRRTKAGALVVFALVSAGLIFMFYRALTGLA